MEKYIVLKDKKIRYVYKRLRRAKSLTITVKPDASVMVTTPYFFPMNFVEQALHKQADWVLAKILHFENTKAEVFADLGDREYQRYKQRARQFIVSRAEELNKIYNFDYHRISVRNQSTVWGSCSQNKNLNFNYKLYFLPGHLAEYVIAHELCHLNELNHSKKFWGLVAQAIPDYKLRIAELKKRY